MGVLTNLEPKNVFSFFEQICSIPHGSGNVEQISDYLAAFAKERGLRYIQDAMKNIIIFKDGSVGYEDHPAVILQGHMDMVAVKEPGCTMDMEKEGLKLGIEGDAVYAEGTSLGGDDGIAVAYGLALLDDDTLSHPPLEVIFTVDEEVGMDGAREIDLSELRGNRMLNLDSEEEGIFLTSCAGGVRMDCEIPAPFTKKEGIAYEIEVGGLLGGHSGAEIHKERGNSNCLMGRILYRLSEKLNLGICKLEGGLADNAIPRQTKAVVVIEKDDSAVFAEVLDTVSLKITDELATKDPGFIVRSNELGHRSYACVAGTDAKRLISWLFVLPCGVQAMSADVEGLVETSLNLGITELEEGAFFGQISIRSSIESAKHALEAKIEALTALVGGKCSLRGDYPGWKYRVDSPLREKMVALYQEMYGTQPKVEAIHAGLECGILGSKIDNLDCISFGPDMKNIHTTEETLSISSTKRVWEYLIRLLERM